MPSDSTLRLSTVTRISRPGKNVGHHTPSSSNCLPSASTLPQDGFGGLTPALMNDKDASNTIASATRTVANTRIGAMQLRATCLARIHHVLAPMTRDADT